MVELNNIPVVIISMSRWDGDYSSTSWSLAKTFSKDRIVIYVDYPYTWTEYLRKRTHPAVVKRKKALFGRENGLIRLKQYSDNLYGLTPPLMVPVNWLPKGNIYDRFSTMTDKNLWKTIKNALRELGQEEFILFNAFNPLYLSVPPKDPSLKAAVYQSQDNIRALEAYLRKHGKEAEVIAIQNAHLSIATSKQLQKDLMELSGRPVEYLPNAADYDLFKKAFTDPNDKPGDLVGISGPIIGYTGNICHRLDYELMRAICENHPDKNLVMVGPRNHEGHTDIDLNAIPNLHFLGPKRLEELPFYLAHFDVLILPFLINEVTKSIYPLKINEYLASGKPVVATPFSEDIRTFGKWISLEDDHQRFSAAIQKELEGDSLEKRKARNQIASKNTWEDRAAIFWRLLQAAMEMKGGRRS